MTASKFAGFTVQQDGWLTNKVGTTGWNPVFIGRLTPAQRARIARITPDEWADVRMLDTYARDEYTDSRADGATHADALAIARAA